MTSYGQKFDPGAVAEQFTREQLAPRIARAAQHALTALQQRIPVERGKNPRRTPGTMKKATHAELRGNGFVLFVDDYVSYFVDQGHKIGDRRTGRARVLRQTAKALRQQRKQTGDETLKDQEDAIRKEATKLNREHAAGRPTVAAVNFVKNTLDAERDTLIGIIAGTA
jgi:hypothetical protein